MRPILLILILSILTSLSIISQKPTVYYILKKQHESSHYYVGYITKATITNSKKRGIDTTYTYQYQGLFETSDKEGLKPIFKFEGINSHFQINNEQYLVVDSKKKKGVLNLQSGKLIIPIAHDNIYKIEEQQLIICDSKSESNIYNSKGEKVNTIHYKKIVVCSSGFYDKVQTGANAKIYNAKNELVVDFGQAKIMEEIFYDNVYIIFKDNKYGVVSAKNETLLPFNYTNIQFSENEISECYEASILKDKIELKTIIKAQEDGSWKEVLPMNFTYITQIEMYNNATTPTENKILEAVYYGITPQNKGVFMDKSGTIILTIENGPKIYQASIFEDRFLEVYINSSDYSLFYALENGKLLLDEGHYFQYRLPAPFDNFLLFSTEGKEYGSCLLNAVNYSLATFNDFISDFGIMKPELQAVYTNGDSYSHLILFDLEKNTVRKSYSLKNYAELDLFWWEQYNYVVAQEDYSKKGNLLVYDLVNDTLIYNGIQTETAYFNTLNSLTTQINNELTSITPLKEQLVNLPAFTTIKNSESTFSVVINSDSLIIPYLSKKIIFEWLDFSNAYCIGTSVILYSPMLGIHFSNTAVLDDQLNLIMPFKNGNVVNIIPTSQGEIIALLHNEDSVNYYNTATGKTLYFNSIYTSLQTKPNSYNFFDWMPFANHVIIYEKDNNYIMDYNGKVLYKSKEINYENVGNNYMLEYADEGGSKVTLFPSLVTYPLSEGTVQEYDAYPYVFVKNGHDYYGLYDAQTGKTVINHDIKSFATFPINESIWIQNKEGKFAIYNLKTNSIGKGYIFESEEAALIEMYGE